MSGYDQLEQQLCSVYGSTAQEVYKRYVKHDPLVLPSTHYWAHVRTFMDEIHNILYDKDGKWSIMTVRPESYFLLTNMCVGRSFTVAELITINIKDITYSNISYDIAYEVLPGYITYRRQTPRHTHHGSDARSYIEPAMVTEQTVKHTLLPPHGYLQPMHPYPPVYHYPPVYPYQHPMHHYPPVYPYQQPIHQPAPEPTKENRPSTPRSELPRPKIIVKPVCIRKGDPKVASSIHVISDEDNIPVDFYSVYYSKNATSIVNDTSTEHHVPYILPIMNRPPPPV
jgi:hypothetical protein